MQYYLLNLYLGRVAAAILGDALCFAAAAAATWFVLVPPVDPRVYVAGAGVGAFGAFASLYYTGAYGLTVLGSGRRTVKAVLAAMGLVFAASLAGWFAFSPASVVTTALAHTAGLYFPLLFGARFLFRRASALPRFSQRVLIIGNSDLGIAIAEAVRERPNLGNDLVGFLSDEPSNEAGEAAGYPILGRVAEIDQIVGRLGIGRIVVASKSRDEYFPAEELLAAKLRGRRVEAGVSFYERVTGRIYLRDLRSSYLIFSDGFVSRRPLSVVVKRVLDSVVSGIALIAVTPVMALAALAIRLDSKGPIFFAQERVGQDGKTFMVLKFRSMRDRAEAETGPCFTQAQDNRITRVGRFIRKTRIDELPQLWNVFRGEMSLVGPRPERREFMDELNVRYPYFGLRSNLKPGVTGWAQVRHGYVNEMAGFEEKLSFDLYYMKYRSVWMDLLILWKTAKTVVLLHGV